MGIACQRHGRFVEALRSAPWLEPDKPIYNPQEELMDLDLQEEIGKLVRPRLMTQRAHEIERIMSSVARLTSSSIEGPGKPDVRTSRAARIYENRGRSRAK